MTALEIPASPLRLIECRDCHEVVNATEWQPKHRWFGEPVMVVEDQERAPNELHMSEGVYWFHRWHTGGTSRIRRWRSGVVIDLWHGDGHDDREYLTELHK